MAIAQRWLWQAQGRPAPAKRLPAATGRCRLCGSPEGAFDADKTLADTFNSHDLCEAPHSPALCAGCAWYLGERTLRLRHWVITPTTAREWPVGDIRRDLLARLAAGSADEPTCYCVSTTHKKHDHLLRCVPTAAASPVVTVRLDVGNEPARLDPARWPALLAAIDGLLALGHRKSEIEAGALAQYALMAHAEWGRASALMRAIRPALGGPELGLALYCTPTPGAAP